MCFRHLCKVLSSGCCIVFPVVFLCNQKLALHMCKSDINLPIIRKVRHLRLYIMTHFLGTPFPLIGLYSCEYRWIICSWLDCGSVCRDQACCYDLRRFIASTRPKAMTFKANFHIIMPDCGLSKSVLKLFVTTMIGAQ